MALSDFGNRENDPGTFHELGIDPETSVPMKLRVRMLTDDKALEGRKKYSTKKKVKGEWVTELDPENLQKLGWENLLWMWTDCEGFSVKLEDESAVELYTEELEAPYSLQTIDKNQKVKIKSDSQAKLKIGDRVILDGRLTSKLKKHLCQRFGFIARFVNEVNNELQQQFGEAEDRLQENL